MSRDKKLLDPFYLALNSMGASLKIQSSKNPLMNLFEFVVELP
jgi:hypothetical protein